MTSAQVVKTARRINASFFGLLALNAASIPPVLIRPNTPSPGAAAAGGPANLVRKRRGSPPNAVIHPALKLGRRIALLPKPEVLVPSRMSIYRPRKLARRELLLALRAKPAKQYRPINLPFDLAYSGKLPRPRTPYCRLGPSRSGRRVSELPADAVKNPAQPVVACHGQVASCCACRVRDATMLF